MTLAVGDVVYLKSGGARMTVESISEDQVACVWQVDGHTKRERFIIHALEKYVPTNYSGRQSRGSPWL